MLKRTIAFIFFLSIITISSVQAQSQEAQSKKEVLVLSSYFQGYAWAENLASAVVSRYAVNRRLTVEVEFLDLVAQRDSVLMREKAESIMNTNDPSGKEIVILIGEEAWIMYRTFMKGAWKEVPCVAVFSGEYTFSAKDYDSGKECVESMKIPLEESRRGFNAALITDPYSIHETIELALQLKPNTKNLALVTNSWQIGYLSRYKTRKVLEQYHPDINFIDLNNRQMTTAELQNRLMTLPKNTTVIFDSWISQNQNATRALYPDNAMRQIVGQLTGDAAFGLYDLGIRDGALAGGVYPTSDEFIEKLQEVLSKIENGTQPKDIPLIQLDNAKRYLNYNTLKAYGIPEELYPADAVYYGKPVSFLERNKVYVIIGLIIMAFFLIVLFTIAVVERKLKKKTKELLVLTKENEAGKTRFIANMGKLIRNPLHVIQMSIDMIDTNHLSEDERRMMKIIANNKTQLINLFDDIIDLGKAGLNDFQLYSANVNVETTLSDIHETQEQCNNLEFTLIPAGREHYVYADPKRLSQVLTYAILNADCRKTEGQVEVKCEGDGKQVKIWVMAHANFQDKDKTELFDAFNDRQPYAQSDRSNLELPLCHKIMEAMGGTITLQKLTDGKWAFLIEMSESSPLKSK